MTCKNCFHYNVCDLVDVTQRIDLANDCGNFANKDEYVKVKHGRWNVTATEFGWNACEYPKEYTCSECGRTEPREEPYCHCGAKMDGGEVS